LSLPVSDAEFAAIIGRVSQMLWKQFGKVHGSEDDFRQQVALWSLEALPRYDATRPLAGYLYRHSRNQALNAVRDKVTRFDYPCDACHRGEPCGPDGAQCSTYARWAKRNQTKANLSSPRPLDKTPEQTTRPSATEDEVVGQELASKIEAELPPKLRADYQKLLDGDWKSVSYSRRARIRKLVAEILGDPDLVRIKVKPASKEESSREQEKG